MHRGTGYARMSRIRSRHGGENEPAAAEAWRGARRARISRIAVPLVSSAIAVAALAGCGNAGVQQYTTQVNNIVFAINNAEGAIKKPWALPLAEQADATRAVADFRKALGSAQEKLDATDPPEVCRKLDDTLRDIVDQGRVMADISTGYSDYVGDMASIAGETNDLVSTLQQLSKANDIPSGLAGLTRSAEKIEGEVRAVVPPSVFNGFHQEFARYVADLVATLQSAEKAIGLDRRKPAENDRQGTTPADEEESRSNEEAESQNRVIEPILEDIPNEWAGFNGKMNSMLDTVRGVIGLKSKVAELEGLIGQAVAEIQSLEKKYK